MSDRRAEQEKARPLVPILVVGAVAAQVIQAVQCGLEEEEIPAEVTNVISGGANIMAKQAAQMSTLNVGIAISQKEREAVLHHRDLPVEQPLFVEKTGRFGDEALRRLGANAARLVKGNPLLFPEQAAVTSPEAPPDTGVEPGADAIARVVSRVVLEVIKQTELQK